MRIYVKGGAAVNILDGVMDFQGVLTARFASCLPFLVYVSAVI